jgi:hypothetical protein
VTPELRIENLVLRLDGRVFEVLALDSDYCQRFHVDNVQFESAPPRNGQVKARVSAIRGANRIGLKMTEAEFPRFSAFVDLVKAAQAAGPEPW